MPADFEGYFRCLAATALDEKTEHSDRACLEALLRQAADDAEPGARVQHEPRRDKSGGGSPDFKVTRAGRIAGYVEVKQIDEALSKVLKSDQIKKYRTLTDNLILTDYLEFIWIKPGGDTTRARLAHSEDLSAKKLALKAENVKAVRALLRGFFSAAPEKIGKGQVLAVALAKRAALLRDFLSAELQRQVKEHREGRLLGLYDSFKTQVFHDLGIGDFADAFAQMLSYGLFLARLNAGDTETVTLENVRKHIPGSFALIRELVRFLDELSEPAYRDIAWVVEELLSIVNGIELAAIHGDLSFRARKAISREVKAEDEEEHRLFERDPFIYFYEDFLKAYDPAMRKSRGVYYTPPPVVNFIVRAIDDILKDSFGIDRGLADHEKVTVLDFACGTGTFLLEVFERIFDTIGGPDTGQADQIVREHLVKNLYGFEYLIAPYTIAHLKLSQYLKDKGHPLKEGERLQVFLTNTLEPVKPQKEMMLPVLSKEVEEAQKVKDRDILVITGNPPYSGKSKNLGEWIKKRIDGWAEEGEGTKIFHLGYKHTIEREQTGDVVRGSPVFADVVRPLGERNPKWLNDDYVKFIRFAQLKIDAVDEGIVGIITNHSWLDNPTFRGMRQSLMRTFNQIYVLDLHGNFKKKEQTPEGAPDGNVFDIEQGVAISILIKCPGLDRGVWKGDLRGRRLEKYRFLADANLSEAVAKVDLPKSPNYLIATASRLEAEYGAFKSLSEVIVHKSVAIVTGNNKLSVAFSRSDIELRLQQALEEKLPWDLVSWSSGALSDIRSAPDPREKVTSFTYTPFDQRFTFYSGMSDGVHVRPRKALSDQVTPKNISLLFTRVTKNEPSAFVSGSLVGNKAVADYDITYFAPVWYLEEENLTTEFRTYLDAHYNHHYTPEEILGYIYAVLYAPSYRSRYAEFLRIDFPRIPFAETKLQFDALSDLGWALVQAHLLKAVPKAAKPLGVYHGKGDHTVEAVRWSEVEEAIWINKTQSFAPVPKAVWEFHIGGYQVLDKYLKSRKGRKLSLDETSHIGKVAATLAFTIDQMVRIDEAYLEAFPETAAKRGVEMGDKSPAPLAS